ncbi:MAG: sugar phosphate isomerase/epimerase, partial [Mucilaginibacter polytrichastri]|nr:sugar phosphate isomerase/epimerase [Mucilaginibacter polytrichastri]
MKNTRRNFIKSSGLVAASLMAPSALISACSGKPGQQAGADSAATDSATQDSAAAGTSSASSNEFGIQLWTVRDDGLEKDPKGVLKKLSDYGYKQIESFEGKNGIFWGLGAKGFKDYADSIGMTPISAHCDINKDFEKKAADAASIGMKYLICPYLGEQKSVDDYKKAAAEFNKRGEICKKNGIRFA